MERTTFRKITAFLISILFVFNLCLAAFAEEPDAENESAPEEGDAYNPFSEEVIIHRLWGFFTAWAEDDTEWLMNICAAEWKKGKEDPRQALTEFLKSGKPHGYKVVSVSGEDSSQTRTAGVILQWKTEDGGYEYRLHEIVCRRNADGYFFDPDGLASGRPAEPVPEEELILMTPEGIIRSSLELHAEPGVYDRLVPIGAGIERQGIRIEIISGLIEGTNAWFMISLQDTDGRYDGFGLEPYFTENVDRTSYGYWSSRLYHDGAERKDTYIVCQELEREMTPENAAVGVTSIRVQEEAAIDLLPMLKQYGGTAEGIHPPKLEDRSYNEDIPDVPEGFRVLDYRHPLDVNLFRDVNLTGIGWIDGQLHVQFHNKGRDFIDIHNGRSSACSFWAEASVYGRTYQETIPGYSPLDWDGDGDGWSEWSECVINCKPEEAEQLELCAEITITTDILEDDWHLLISTDQIRAVSGQAPDGTAQDPSGCGTESGTEKE